MIESSKSIGHPYTGRLEYLRMKEGAFFDNISFSLLDRSLQSVNWTHWSLIKSEIDEMDILTTLIFCIFDFSSTFLNPCLVRRKICCIPLASWEIVFRFKGLIEIDGKGAKSAILCASNKKR